ncbi:MAG TPA: hypothetical protein HPP83_01235 [Candidatus Hydrogenedentes bacterium]|nr:hypothetical protein [Candidatus Hydrogenedentota bacterium]
MAETEIMPQFVKAMPIWPAGRELDKNLFVGFRARFDCHADAKHVLLRVTGAVLYRIFLNGAFVGYGPVRAAHGYCRVDEIDLAGRVTAGPNLVALEVAGYNCKSFYVISQPSFLQAEILVDGEVLAATGCREPGFEARLLERAQKTVRYSFQRTFTEVYRLGPECHEWRDEADTPMESVACATYPEKKLLPRRVPYCTFEKCTPRDFVARGRLEPFDNAQKQPCQLDTGAHGNGFAADELETVPHMELQDYAPRAEFAKRRPYTSEDVLALGPLEYADVDFGEDFDGFFGATVACREPTRLLISFDDLMIDGQILFLRSGCVNLVTYELEPGTYQLEFFEPYCIQFVRVQTLAGACEVSNLYVREFVNPDMDAATFESSDSRLNEIFEAGRETLRQCTCDALMADPPRERGAWIVVDSPYTARGTFALLNDPRLERDLFENYLLPDRYEGVPKDMFPAVYPADNVNGFWIVNTAFYTPIQLEEYYLRSGDRAMVDAFEPKIMAFLKYYEPFKNEDGLLEDLDGWIFIEWSRAADFTAGIHYPTNMLYARSLAAVSRLYDRPELAEQSERLHQMIRDQAFDGDFFVDNAVRKDGQRRLTGNRSEVCQYAAFDCGTATPETHPKLWKTLCEDFGPARRVAGQCGSLWGQCVTVWPEIVAANSLPGLTWRLDLLQRFGETQRMFDDAIRSLLHMARASGTLWEHVDPVAGLSHAFQGVICELLYQGALGVRRIDPVGKRIELRFAEHNLAWCKGRIPTPDGFVEVAWQREAKQIVCSISAPKGYQVETEDLTGRVSVTRQN